MFREWGMAEVEAMKIASYLSASKLILCGLGVPVMVGSVGCAGVDPLTQVASILGGMGGPNRTAVNDYVFYPDYNLYYNRRTEEFLAVENGAWVTRRYPLNVSAQRVLASRAVNIDRYGSPEHHYDQYYSQNRRYGQYQRVNDRRSNW